MGSSNDQAKVKVLEWVQKHPHAVLYHDESSTLLDVASGKSVRIAWGEVKAFEEKSHPETEDTYVVVLFEDDHQVALVYPGGVAFPPSDANTGPLSDLPPVVCLRDLQKLKERVDHHLYAHQEEPPPKECLDWVLICIAILDGARAVGFNVGEMEEELNRSLREIERRTS